MSIILYYPHYALLLLRQHQPRRGREGRVGSLLRHRSDEDLPRRKVLLLLLLLLLLLQRRSRPAAAGRAGQRRAQSEAGGRGEIEAALA